MSRMLWMGCALASGLLAGCGSGPDGQVVHQAASGAPVVEARLAVAPSLRARLPAATAGYLRIPSPWGQFAAPDGRSLDPARLQPAHVAAVDTIRRAIAAEPALAQGPAVLAKLLLSHWAGPLEIAVLAPARRLGPDARLLVQVPLQGIADGKALAQLLAALGAPGTIEFDAQGYAMLDQAAARYDAELGQLQLLFGGAGVDLAALQQLQAGMQVAAPPFAASEARIDQSGQGLYGWLDLASVHPLLLPGMGDDFGSRALAECKALAFGFGTVDGKGRLGVELEAPEAQFLRWLPREPREFRLRTAGVPEYAGSLSILPSPQEFVELRAALAAEAGSEAEQALQAGLAQARTLLGVDLELLLAAFGPDVGMFRDAAGDFLALKIRDRAAYERLLAALNQLPRTRLARNGDIHLLELPAAGPQPDAAELQEHPLLALAARLRSRLYWIEDGEYLLFAAVPQALRDRRALKPDTALDGWLAAQRGPQYRESLLLLAAQTRHVPRQGYYAWLGALATLADLAGAEFDPFAFASARELALPTSGSAGLGLETSRNGLSLALSYDVSGFDVFGGESGLAAVAVAGILAAVAVPAYTDYTQRAKVAEALALASAAKLAIVEYTLSNGRAPATLADAGVAATSGRHASLEWENNLLLLRFSDPALAGQQLALGLKADGQSWACGYAEAAADAATFLGPNPAEHTTVAPKALPESCR